jgi:hypothetical protein
MYRLFVFGALMLATSPVMAQKAIDPLFTRFALPDSGKDARANKTKVLELLDWHNALPMSLRSRSGDLATNWSFRAPREWEARSVLGYGVNLQDHPNMWKKPTLAVPVVSPDLLAGGTINMQTVVQYFSSEEQVRKSTEDSTDVSLGFTIGDFGLSADYGSGRLESSQRSHNRSFLVISYFDLQSFDVGATQLTTAARTAWNTEPRSTFFARYGTHYVSRMQVKAHFTVVYTFSSDSSEVMEAFNQKAGLKAGYAGWTAGFMTQVNDASTTYKSSVRSESRVTAAGHAGIGLPNSLDLDYAAIQAVAEQYIERVKTDREGLPVVRYSITPFSALSADVGPLTSLALADAASTLEDIQDTAHDARLVLDYHDFYGVPLQQQLDFLDAIQAHRGEIVGSMLRGLSARATDDEPRARDIQAKLRTWLTFMNDPANQWPFDPAGPRISFTSPSADNFEAEIMMPRSVVSNLTARVITITYPAMATDPALSATTAIQFQSVTVVADPSDPMKRIHKYKTEPINIPAGTTDRQSWLEVTDGRGRSFVYLLTSRAGRQPEFASPPTPLADMVAGPR